jgi:hypothetical protein
MLRRKPTRIELKPEEKAELAAVKQAQAEAKGQQSQQFQSQGQGTSQSVATRIGLNK